MEWRESRGRSGGRGERDLIPSEENEACARGEGQGEWVLGDEGVGWEGICRGTDRMSNR